MGLDTGRIDEAHFLSDAWIDDVLENGFDAGASFHEPGSPIRDLDSVERMVEELSEKMGFDPDDATAVRAGVAAWMPLRLAYVRRRLAGCETNGDGHLVCTRVLRVDEATARAIASGQAWPGEFWSSGGEAEPFWARDESLPELFLTAHVDPADVDWQVTVARNMNYVYGDEECEIVLRRDARPAIVEAELDGECILDPAPSARP